MRFISNRNLFSIRKHTKAEFTEESNHFSDKKETDAPKDTILNNVEAYIYQVTDNNAEYEMHIVYGETDYAHYLLMNTESKLNPHSDDYMESYFAGYEYWAEEDSGARKEIYEKLQNASDNPYSVDFGMNLEKSW